MHNIEDAELLPKFFEEIRHQYGNGKFGNAQFMISTMADLLPDSTELRRCMRLVYDSKAMVAILDAAKDLSNGQLYRNKAVEKLVRFTFMEKQLSISIIDSVMVAVYPELKQADYIGLSAEKISLEQFSADQKVSKSYANVDEDSLNIEELYNKGVECYEADNYEEAVKLLMNAAEKGHAGAQYYLAICCSDGRGISKNEFEAVKWYRLAAEQENEMAQYDLGLFYHLGRGVSKDDAQSLYWYTKSAENGLKEARHKLGDFYFNGDRVKKDVQEAIKWYRLAAERGYGPSQMALGECYYSGIGVKRDKQLAAYWYEKAAHDSLMHEAQYKIALCYDEGIGVKKNLEKAFYWFKEASVINADACYRVAMCYKKGRGVAKDKDLAQVYMKWAADNGCVEAQKQMAGKESFLESIFKK